MNSDMPLGVKFSIIYREFKSRIDEYTKEMGLTSVQSGVLRAVSKLEREGASEVNQRDIEAAMGLTHQTVTEIIKKLESNGFVECRKSETDKRSKAITLTDKTRDLYASFPSVDNRVLADICEGIPPDQVDIMVDVIDRMLDNIFENKNSKNN